MSEHKEGYLRITGMDCQSCKVAVPFQANFARSLDEVWAVAEKVHASTGIVCPNPLIAVSYVPVLVSESLDKLIVDACEKVEMQKDPQLINIATGGPH